MKMKRYNWTAWDLPITGIRLYYGTEAVDLIEVAYSEPIEYDWEE